MPFPWIRPKPMANPGASSTSGSPTKRSSRSSRTTRSSSRSTKSTIATSGSASSSSSAGGPAVSTATIVPQQPLQQPSLSALSTQHPVSTPLADPPAYSPSHPGTTPHSPNEARPRVPPPPPPKERSREQRRELRGGRDSRHTLVPGSNLLQPRVAVVLGIPRRWHLVLFVCRLLSIVPACYWGLPATVNVLAQLGMLWLSEVQGLNTRVDKGLYRVLVDRTERRLLFTEAGLAAIWVCASGYLSFFFTDSLMSRWLVTYTPQATVIRLLSISAINGYVTSWVLYLAGGIDDPRLLLPAWISIATTLTIAYHLTQRKINIRKETSASISIFSIASYISMVLLLWQLQLSRGPGSQHSVPLFEIAQRSWTELGKFAVKVINSAGTGSARTL